jgi:GPI mannosyltransferase 3
MTVPVTGMANESVLTYLALALRIGIALCTRGFFQPDEYFQSLEPAHHLVFGYGQLTWEWRSSLPIRSIIYPGLNTLAYLPLRLIGLDRTLLLVGRCSATPETYANVFIHV